MEIKTKPELRYLLDPMFGLGQRLDLDRRSLDFEAASTFLHSRVKSRPGNLFHHAQLITLCASFGEQLQLREALTRLHQVLGKDGQRLKQRLWALGGQVLGDEAKSLRASLEQAYGSLSPKKSVNHVAAHGCISILNDPV